MQIKSSVASGECECGLLTSTMLFVVKNQVLRQQKCVRLGMLIFRMGPRLLSSWMSRTATRNITLTSPYFHVMSTGMFRTKSQEMQARGSVCASPEPIASGARSGSKERMVRLFVIVRG